MILRDSLGLYGAKLGVGAGGFFAWWRSALASWLPARWRALFGMSSDRLLLTPVAGELRLRLARGTEIRDLAQVPTSDLASSGDPLASLFGPSLVDLPRWLVLPASSSLRRRLLLPAAAADRLRDVLGFEIERQTPFAAADVVFDATVGRRRPDGQLEVELLTVPKTGFEAAIAELGGLADSLAGVDVADAAGVPLGVNLLLPSRRYRAVDPWRTWNWALAAVAVLALAIGLWQMLENRRMAADQLQQEVASRSAAARRVAIQRQQLNDVVQGAAFLDRTRHGRPTMVEILDELSRRLPDNTYLEKLAVEDNRLLLIGLSTEASALVARLEGSPLWRSPALTGALQPDPRTHRDRFTLTAELAISGAATKEAARGDRPN
ncbi:MAG TPA: PilN domain-containing protein [Luteimonas sp.]|nr:PilN domain-containing protein [Luteimonas sp.]